jgi:hypothetical protein
VLEETESERVREREGERENFKGQSSVKDVLDSSLADDVTRVGSAKLLTILSLPP